MCSLPPPRAILRRGLFSEDKTEQRFSHLSHEKTSSDHLTTIMSLLDQRLVEAPLQQPEMQMVPLGARGLRPLDPFGAAVRIQQHFRPVELCVELNNRYTVHPADGSVPLFVSEESRCCERICCGPNRKLTLLVHAGPTEDFPVLLRLEKCFHLQGCCCCRPTMRVLRGDGAVSQEGEFLGRVEDPWYCCFVRQEVRDRNGVLRFMVEGTQCQGGMCCPCCDAEFTVVPRGDSREVGSREDYSGALTKKASGWREALVSAQNYELIFPPGLDAENLRGQSSEMCTQKVRTAPDFLYYPVQEHSRLRRGRGEWS